MSTADQQLPDIEAQIKTIVPASVTISKIGYEGPEIIIYTDDPQELFSHEGLVQEIAQGIQKRVTVRPTTDVLPPKKTVKNVIHDVVPDEAHLTNIEFNDDIGEVIIEAENPEQVVGQHGRNLHAITQQTGWTPEILRTPPLDSSTVDDVRNYLKREREDRHDILERVGRQIHRDTTSDDSWVRVTTLGCCREVGRSAFVINTTDSRILVDCGDKPGSDDVPYLQVAEALGAKDSFDAVVLTHAHLDHSALIPLLFKYGYDGPVYMTPPTRDLMGLLTLDYLNVAGKQGRTPPYESTHVQEAIKHTIPIEYNEITDITPDVTLSLHNSGHILGSASAHFNVNDGEHNLVFSSDIHQNPTHLFNGANNQFPGADTLILESTYGGNDDYQESQADAEHDLKQAIVETHARDGTVLIPSFAVGRSQELMLILEEAMREGEIPKMPVHLDGMIREATAIHTAHPEYLRDDVRDRIMVEGENPFLAEQFNHIDGGESERRSIRDSGPNIILTTSGMVTGGPVMSWLKHLSADPDNTMMFVGYQAEGTLGREIQNGRNTITVDDHGQDQQLTLDFDIRSVSGFSGHADRAGLEEYATTMRPQPDKVLCVHGDEKSVQQLSSGLYHDYNMNTFAPKNLETFRFK
ncbi:beta-CASP ribonuclease aCPSF1 [Salinibaculum rarum]|uniref:beta-CASP ribonuclease aCPSF1 n=1 Tax=Salinibaculum rarum TaxID=3058903 RepID=UPI00265EF5FC|nr:beta-CASP ribonuclease aCPSF1 [Salinibaculum sp. KK48]